LACSTALCTRATNRTKPLRIYSFKNCSPYLTPSYNPYLFIFAFVQTPLLVLVLVLDKLHWFWILGTILTASFNGGLLLYFGSVASGKLNEIFSSYKLSIDSTLSTDGLPYLLPIILWLLDVGFLLFIWITRIKFLKGVVFSAITREQLYPGQSEQISNRLWQFDTGSASSNIVVLPRLNSENFSEKTETTVLTF
jgi:hypothetical protein